jgi:hypothetical protein
MNRCEICNSFTVKTEKLCFDCRHDEETGSGSSPAGLPLNQRFRACAVCAEPIRSEAKICRFCGRDQYVSSVTPTTNEGVNVAAAAETKEKPGGKTFKRIAIILASLILLSFLYVIAFGIPDFLRSGGVHSQSPPPQPTAQAQKPSAVEVETEEPFIIQPGFSVRTAPLGTEVANGHCSFWPNSVRIFNRGEWSVVTAVMNLYSPEGDLLAENFSTFEVPVGRDVYIGRVSSGWQESRGFFQPYQELTSDFSCVLDLYTQ